MGRWVEARGRRGSRAAFVVRGGLEEKVLGAVGNVGHAILRDRESVEQLLGVVVRDGQDEIGPGKNPAQEVSLSGRARI